MSNENNLNNKLTMESFGKMVGTILGITLITMWVTVVATFTHNWYMGS